MRRFRAISLRAFQNASSRLTLVLWPAKKTERLAIGDFMTPSPICIEDTQTTKMARHYGHLAIILKRDRKNTTNRMPLKMRQTGLGSGAYQDNVDYNVFSGEVVDRPHLRAQRLPG